MSKLESVLAEMVRIAERVVPIPCATDLEAHVREIRIIEAEQPRYNRRSRRAGSVSWLKLTVEAAPRLSVVRSVADDFADGGRYLGPFTSSAAAQSAARTAAQASAQAAHAAITAAQQARESRMLGRRDPASLHS